MTGQPGYPTVTAIIVASSKSSRLPRNAAIVDLKGHLTSGSIDRLGAEFDVPVSGATTQAEQKNRDDENEGDERKVNQQKKGEARELTSRADAHREAKPSGGRTETASTAGEAGRAHAGETGSVKLTGVIIGQELAKQLGVDVGDPVSVVSPMGTASPVGMIPKVKRLQCLLHSTTMPNAFTYSHTSSIMGRVIVIGCQIPSGLY